MPITQDNAGVFLPLLWQWLQNSRREGAEGAEQKLCHAAVQKLSEYIQLNFSVDESKLQTGSCGASDTEICTVYLAQEMRKTEVLGLSFGNIPALGDYGEKRRGGKKRKGHKGPVLDVGCIWVTDLKKNSPAGKCGRVRLKDEVLSLNGQLMVGVDVTGASLSSSASILGDLCRLLPGMRYGMLNVRGNQFIFEDAEKDFQKSDMQ
ncbi:hypothetical protein ASZ78_013069 [Callipepla squamata]|uniref:PDZ domain-containing protein n=1 Tax=Callipepla squamata TaxID=9009 RepID=A0A226NH01_CALSU|nr:hypothetical protein ASZ78_013069 [Callipepla squamata]